ncbi:MAG: hypothetical protein Q7K40_01280 [bacterium]|nr:hypothetical protein [bacterium]
MDKKKKITKEDIKSFQRYLIDSPLCIGELIESLGEEGKKLDFTPESLKFIDTLLKEKIKKVDPIRRWEELDKPGPELTQEEKWLIVRLAYYLAEVLIQNLGAEWDIEKRSSHAQFKRAVLRIKNMLNGVDTQRAIFATGRNPNAKSLYDWYSRNFIEKKPK